MTGMVQDLLSMSSKTPGETCATFVLFSSRSLDKGEPLSQSSGVFLIRIPPYVMGVHGVCKYDLVFTQTLLL